VFGERAEARYGGRRWRRCRPLDVGGRRGGTARRAGCGPPSRGGRRGM